MSWHTKSGAPSVGAFGQSTTTPIAASKPTSVFGAFGVGASAFGGGSAPMPFGSTAPTGTLTPTYAVFAEKDPNNPSTILSYISISAMPAYSGTSLEELRVQDYLRSRTTSVFGLPLLRDHVIPSPRASSTSHQPIFGSTSGGSSTAGAFGGFGLGTDTTFAAFGQATSAMGFKGAFHQSADPSKQEGMEVFYRKFLLGEEIANTQFHLYSAKSSSSGRVVKPRVLCANNAILAKSSTYLLNLLSSDINPSDPWLSDLMDPNDVPDEAGIDDYGYESDSDLDECDDPVPERSKDPTTSRSSTETEPKNYDELFSSVASRDKPRMDRQESKEDDGSVALASNQTSWKSHGTMHLRSLASRHILVKDTAFKTFYTMLDYLSTGKIEFLPLSSVTPEGKPRASSSLISPSDRPKCSAMSMYRLACKVELNDLRDKALAHIQSNLSQHNILQEISGSLVHDHPQLLHMCLDMLHVHISSPPVVANFPAFLKRIADGEMPHGAEILVDVYKWFMNIVYPFTLLASEMAHASLSPTSPQDAPAPSVSVGQPTDGRGSNLANTEEYLLWAHGDEGEGRGTQRKSEESGTPSSHSVFNTGRRSSSGKKKRR